MVGFGMILVGPEETRVWARRVGFIRAYLGRAQSGETRSPSTSMKEYTGYGDGCHKSTGSKGRLKDDFLIKIE